MNENMCMYAPSLAISLYLTSKIVCNYFILSGEPFFHYGSKLQLSFFSLATVCKKMINSKKMINIFLLSRLTIIHFNSILIGQQKMIEFYITKTTIYRKTCDYFSKSKCTLELSWNFFEKY